MNNIDELIKNAENRVTELSEYKSFREHVVERMQWESMRTQQPDEEHEDTWFSEPTEDDIYYYGRYKMYQKVLEILDKEFLK